MRPVLGALSANGIRKEVPPPSQGWFNSRKYRGCISNEQVHYGIGTDNSIISIDITFIKLDINEGKVIINFIRSESVIAKQT